MCFGIISILHIIYNFRLRLRIIVITVRRLDPTILIGNGARSLATALSSYSKRASS